MTSHHPASACPPPTTAPAPSTSVSLGDDRHLRSLIELALPHLETFLRELEQTPAVRPGLPGELLAALRSGPGERPGDPQLLVETLMDAARSGPEGTGPRNFSYVSGGGLSEAAVGELIALVLNRFVAYREFAPGLAAVEEGVVDWMASLMGLPAGAGGLLTTGGSHAILTMMVAARESLRAAGAELADGRIYVSDQAHHSIAEAAHLVGLSAQAVRVLPSAADHRLAPDTVAQAVQEDRLRGAVPFLLVGTAGSTDLGVVDPLEGLADVARDHGLWFHVDACYGGFFRLTERGRSLLSGIERADSVSLDPHKSLFLPFGTGALVVRDPARLARSHSAVQRGNYLADVSFAPRPDFADLGFELTREARGLRVWLPLHLNGTASFAAALNEKLDLAQELHAQLADVEGLDVVGESALSIVALRAVGGDEATRALIKSVNESGVGFCSSTVVDGRLALRVCVLAVRIRRHHVRRLVEVIRAALT